MASEIEDLKKRVEQLEKALWAVVFNKPTGCDKDGRIMALPFVRTSSPPGTMPVYGSKPVED